MSIHCRHPYEVNVFRKKSTIPEKVVNRFQESKCGWS